MVCSRILVVCGAPGADGVQPSQTPEAGGDGDDGPFIVARTADIDGRDPATATAFQTVQTLDLVYDTLIETDDDGRARAEPRHRVGGQRRRHDGHADAARRRAVPQRRRRSPRTTRRRPSTGCSTPRPARWSRPTSPTSPRCARSTTPRWRSTLAQPDTALLDVLSQVGTAILDTDDIEAGDVGREVNGTGPFRWGSWDQGEQVTLEANEDYWGEVPQLSDGGDAGDPGRVVDPVGHAGRQLRPRHRLRPRRRQPGRREATWSCCRSRR